MKQAQASLKEVGTALLLSCCIAAGVAAFSNASAAHNAEVSSVSVNRTLKADRLPVTAKLSQHVKDSSPAKAVLPKRTPIGCDLAFSPVAEPGRPAVFKRCMV